MANDAIDFALPQYTPCGKGHTHHASDWSLNGVLSIDKCERQCRFRACKAWSRSAAALRKHVIAHIMNNNLDLKVLPATNGREPVKILCLDALVMPRDNEQHTILPDSTIELTHSPSNPSSAPMEPSDSGYASRGSSMERLPGGPGFEPPRKRPVPFDESSPIKRLRHPTFEEARDHFETPRGDTPQDFPHVEAQEDENPSSGRLLDNVQNFPISPTGVTGAVRNERDSNNQTSLCPKPNPFRDGSPLAPYSQDVFSYRRIGNTTYVENQRDTVAPHMAAIRPTGPIIINSQQRPKSSDSDAYNTSSELPIYSFLKQREDSRHAGPPNNSLAYESWVPRRIGGYTLKTSDNLDKHLKVYDEITTRRDRLSSTVRTSTDLPQGRGSSTVEQPLSGVETEVDGQSEHPVEDLIDPWMCPIIGCGQFLGSLSHLRKHKQKHTKYWRCDFPDCPRMTEIFPSGDDLNCHIQQVHPNPEDGHTLSLSDSPPQLVCPTCYKAVKTYSEMKKHDLRHTKPFRCEYPGCPRTEGFSNTNDLDRHILLKHPDPLGLDASSGKYRCHFPGCKSADKFWSRIDNFRSHVRRVHGRQLTESGIENPIRGTQFDPIVLEDPEPKSLRPRTPPGWESTSANDLDLQSLHVLADSAMLGHLYSQWPLSKEQTETSGLLSGSSLPKNSK